MKLCEITDFWHEEFEHTINGEVYKVTVDNIGDDDARARSQRVILPNGKNVMIDWSPNSRLLPSDLEMWVNAGMPTRKDLKLTGPLNREDLKKYLNGLKK